MSNRITSATIDQVQYVQTPMAFYNNPIFKSMGALAKLAYPYLLNLVPLSIENKWINQNNEYYIKISRKKLAAVLDISATSSATLAKIMAELTAKGLIEERKRGLNLCNEIYVCIPPELGIIPPKEQEEQAPQEAPQDPQEAPPVTPPSTPSEPQKPLQVDTDAPQPILANEVPTDDPATLGDQWSTLMEKVKTFSMKSPRTSNLHDILNLNILNTKSYKDLSFSLSKLTGILEKIDRQSTFPVGGITPDKTQLVKDLDGANHIINQIDLAAICSTPDRADLYYTIHDAIQDMYTTEYTKVKGEQKHKLVCQSRLARITPDHLDAMVIRFLGQQRIGSVGHDKVAYIKSMLYNCCSEYVTYDAI